MYSLKDSYSGGTRISTVDKSRGPRIWPLCSRLISAFPASFSPLHFISYLSGTGRIEIYSFGLTGALLIQRLRDDYHFS